MVRTTRAEWVAAVALFCCVAAGVVTSAAAAAPAAQDVRVPRHPDGHVFRSVKRVSEKGDDVENAKITETFRSPRLPLHPGGVINSDPRDMPLRFPEGKVGIVGFVAEVVDRNGTSVPLYEVYNHHWIIFDGHGNGGPCQSLSYVFGVGAESRGTRNAWGLPYVLETRGDEVWNANIHVIRSGRFVQDTKGCIECRCPQGLPGDVLGRIACCEDGFTCGTAPHSGEADADREYFLQYQVTYYAQVTPEMRAVEVFVLDVTKCQVEGDIRRNPACPMPIPPPLPHPHWTLPQQRNYGAGPAAVTDARCVDHMSVEQEVPYDMDLVFTVGHQHIGAINITLSRRVAADGSLAPICTSLPTVGSGWEAGNEKGYITAISMCNFTEKPLRLRKGEVLHVESLYRADSDYGGIMGLSYIVAARANAV